MTSNVSRRGQSKFPPIRNWIFDYDFRTEFMYDLTAGITVGIMAIPQSMGYALLAGLPPQYGLYSDLQICYPIFGTSKYIVVGPVAVMSLMSRAAMERVNVAEGSMEWIDMVCFLSVLVCLIQLVIGTLGIGTRLMKMLPESAISAFSSAAALIIASTQLPGLLGLPKCKNGSGQSCGFLGTIFYSVTNLQNANPASLAVGCFSLAVLIAMKRIRGNGLLPKLGPLAVVLSTVLFFYFTRLNSEGKMIETWGDVAVVGHIPVGLPTPRWIPTLPRNMDIFISLFFSALPIALVGFAEASAICKTSTKLRGGDVSAISDDSEIIALGACNGFTAIVGGYPVTGSFSRTAINSESGARSALSTAIAALAVVIVLILLTTYLAYLPKAAVSAIVLSAILRLVNLEEFLHIWEKQQTQHVLDVDSIIFLCVFVSALVLGVETGLFLGIVVHQFYPRPTTPIISSSKSNNLI